jgi:hypothetical protein
MKKKKAAKAAQTRQVERIQVGARMEKTLVKVLKGLAEYLDISFGDLLEGITLHALDGKAPFSKETLAQVERLRIVYRLELTAENSHQLVEAPR